MSRSRTIKPEWLNDEIAHGSSDARVLSVGLVLLADDHGRGKADPLVLSHRVFPFKNLEVFSRSLDELLRSRYGILYEHEGQKYYALRTFSKHQSIANPARPKTPHPAAKGSVIITDLREYCKGLEKISRTFEKLETYKTHPIYISDQDLTLFLSKLDPDQPDMPGFARGRGKGKWRRIPESWKPNDSHRKLALENGLNIALEEQKIRDHEFARTKSDPDATFRNWLRSAAGSSPAASAPFRRSGPAPVQRDRGVDPFENADNGDPARAAR